MMAWVLILTNHLGALWCKHDARTGRSSREQNCRSPANPVRHKTDDPLGKYPNAQGGPNDDFPYKTHSRHDR